MVHALLEPPQALLRPLRIPSKFALVTLMFLVSALVPAGFMVTNQNRELNHLGLERRGAAFLSALCGLAEHVAEAQLACRNQMDGSARAEDNGPSLENLEFSIDADLATLKGLDLAAGTQLKTGARVQALAEGWGKVTAEKDPQAHLAALTGFMGDLLALNAMVVDTSGLIVDADMACFYVIDICTMELPQQAAGLIRLSSAAQAAAAGGPLNELGRDELQRQVGAIRAQLEDLKGKLSGAKGFSRPEVAEPLGVRLSDHLKVSEAFLAQVGAGVLGPQVLVSQPGLRYNGRQAVLSTFSLQSAALRVLENLLTLRIRHLRFEQRVGLGGSLSAALLAFYLLAALYRGLKDGLDELDASLKGLRAGDLTREAQVGTGDELRILAEDLNETMTSLRGLASALRQGTQAVQEGSAEAAALSARLTVTDAVQGAGLGQVAASVAALAAAAGQAGRRGSEACQEALRVGEGLRNCQEAGLGATRAIADLKASAAQVEKIADGTEGVAFQAKLLAVNALQLAEHGKQERELSQLASELHALGRRGTMAANDLKAFLRESAGLIAAGGRDLARACEAMREMGLELAALTDLVREAGEAAQEQARCLGELGETLSRLGADAGGQATQLQQVGSATETLAGQARSLAGLVAPFRY